MYTKLPNGQIVYAEDISCVLDPVNGKGGIFIGNLEASQNPNTLKKHGIKAVLTACKGIMLEHPKSVVPYYLNVPGQDKDGFDLSRFFPQSVNFIRDSLQKTNILVHCLAGVSRSVSLVIAYLMKCRGMSYNNSFQMLKAKRRIIHPNEGFIAQLRKYQRDCMDRQSPPKQNPTEDYMYRGYSASPSKQQRKYDPRHFQNYDEEFYRSRVNPYESPSKRDDQRYDSPTKNRKYLGKYDISESPSKRNTGDVDRLLKKYQPYESKVDSAYNPERSQIKQFYERGRTYSDIKYEERNEKESISRMDENFKNLNDELDEKIAKIRQKYSEYANFDPKSSPRRNRQPKYNNYFDENQLTGGLGLKKMTSEFHEKETTYGVLKRNYQRPSGLGVRKLNSMREY